MFIVYLILNASATSYFNIALVQAVVQFVWQPKEPSAKGNLSLKELNRCLHGSILWIYMVTQQVCQNLSLTLILKLRLSIRTLY